MAKCDYCNSTILFGGKQEGGYRFCNAECLQQGSLLQYSRQVPEQVVNQYISQVHQGACPKCNGPGPVDVHTSHRVWSALLLTSWSSHPQVSCRSCGVKSQLGNTVFSLALGWWGFPWGIIFTPIQVLRNIGGMVSGVNPAAPSAQLEKILRMQLAANLLQQQNNQSPLR